MKKTFLFAAFAAALAFAVSCNKVNQAEPETPALRTVQFNALPMDTKTVFGEKNGNKYPVLWTSSDTKVGVSLNYSDIATLSVTPSSDGSTASFSGKFSESSTYRFMVVSPEPAFKSRNATNKTVLVEFPAGQTSTAASPDANAQILFADTKELPSLPEEIDLQFEHLSAYLHLQFTNVELGDATVQAVNITYEDAAIAGRIFFYPDEDRFEVGSSSLFNTIAVSTTTLDDVWCGLCPVDLSGKKLTIVVSTDKGTMSKDVNMPSQAVLTRGKIGKFTVDMSGISLEKPVIYKAVTDKSQLHIGDKVIIAAAEEESAFAMSTGQNGNNRSQIGVNKTLTEITNPTDEVEIIELEDGLIPGQYALKATGAANPGYLYAASLDGAANYLRTKATVDNSASWTISIEEITISSVTTPHAAVIQADIPEPGHGTLRRNNGDGLFSAYSRNSSQRAVMLYRLDVPADESPRFKATLPDGSDINAETQTVRVCVFGNVAWSADVTGGASLDVTSGTGAAVLTLSVPENTDTENTKTYSVTVTTTASVPTSSYTLTLTQAKKIDTSGDPEKVYSFSLSKGNNLGTNNSYAGNCDITISGITWNVTGVSNSTSYDGWRLGGKGLTNVPRAIYAKTAIPAEITKIVVTHAAMNITINSFTMSVHSTSADASTGSNPIASITGTASKTDPTVFEKSDNKSWAGSFIRLEYNVTNTDASNNKYVQFKGMEIWGYLAN